MVTACQFKIPNYLSNKIYHGHIVPPLYFHNRPYFSYLVWNKYFEYFFEFVFNDLNKNLGTISQDDVRGNLLTSSKL